MNSPAAPPSGWLPGRLEVGEPGCSAEADVVFVESGIAGEVLETGVDFISVGALTHSVTAFDLGTDLRARPAEGEPA